MSVDNDSVVAELARSLSAKGQLIVDIKVVPRASKSEIVGPLADGALKVKVAAVPEDGKANQELCRVLAEALSLSARKVTVISGATSTRKRVRIES